MPSTVEHLGPCEKSVEVTIEAATIQAAMNSKFSELRQQITLPGFRPGKVPRSLLERRFGAHVRSELLEELVEDAMKAALDEQKLEPLSQPDFDFSMTIEKNPLAKFVPPEGEELPEQPETEDGEKAQEPIQLPTEGDFVFGFKLDTKPEFELPKHRGLAVERKTRPVKDEQVKEVLERAAERAASYEAVEDDDAVYGEEDLVQVLTTAKLGDDTVVDEEALYWHAKAPRLGDDIELVDGENLFAGSKVGSKLETTGVMREDHDDEELRGKEVDLALEIQELRRMKVPDIDDAFAETLGKESLSEVMDQIRGDLEKQMSEIADRVATDDLLDQVVEATTIDLPQRHIDNLVKDRVHRRAHEIQETEEGKDHDAAMAEAETERPEIREKVEQGMRLELVIEAIAEKQKIFALEEDVLAEYAKIAEENGATVQQVRDFYEQQRLTGELRAQIRDRKVRAYVLEEAKVTDVEATEEDGSEGEAQGS